jgi:prophage maintenance system killer protein
MVLRISWFVAMRKDETGDCREIEDSEPTEEGGYSPRHVPRGILQAEPGSPSEGPKDDGPSGFPSIEDLKHLNREIHDDAGTPERFKLDQPAPLGDCLSEARAAYSDCAEGVIGTAALLAHGIARAQAFFDGNRRTAYFVALAFLNDNGYGHLSTKEDDQMLARYLNQVVEPATGHKPPGPQKFEELFIRRLRKREE